VTARCHNWSLLSRMQATLLLFECCQLNRCEEHTCQVASCSLGLEFRGSPTQPVSGCSWCVRWMYDGGSCVKSDVHN